MKRAHRASKKSQKHGDDYGAAQMSVPASIGSGRAKPSKRTLTGVRIERAQNGFTLHKNYEGPHGEYISSSSKPEVFTGAESLLAAVTKALA